MELVDYRKDYLENVKMQAAAENEGTVAMFVNTVLSDLQDLNLINDFENCYAVGKYGRKNYRVDAYCFDDYDYSMSIFIADLSGEQDIETLTRTEAIALFDKGYAFLEGCLYGNFINTIEISTTTYDLVERIINLKNTVRKYRFFIITDKIMSERITSLEVGCIGEIPIEYNIWDIQRLFRVMSEGYGYEPVTIDFQEFISSGLPCLEASDVSTNDIKYLLCVIPGRILADLYDIYGSRLLEGNVRSFLSTKGAVNKNIRKTILEMDGENKRMFFSYNNGISATATSVNISEESNGKYITSINNLQIVNGGQTTASLSNTRFKDKANLEGIFVQMKLTVIPNHDLAQRLIPKISKGSNSQNKVSDADFFSNHDFNIRMEQISRRIYAPTVNGQQYETHWFFERSRGQYEQEQAKMTISEKGKFQMQNPKDQKITKTDFAKYQNCWREYPYKVSMGMQKNFSIFADYIVDEWSRDDIQFNEQYFRDTIVLAIIYKCIDKMVLQQKWYEKGYKANIVVYTLSFFHYLLDKQFPKSALNMSSIWDIQNVPDELCIEFVALTKFVFDHITNEERPITNVTEWCKKEQCWITLKAREYVLKDSVCKLLISKEELRKEKANGKKEYSVVNGIQVQVVVVEKGQEYWEKVLQWGKSKHLLTDVDISFLSSATKINYGRIPSDKQCQRILNIEAKLLEEGFSESRCI